jgi:hypothetical protein
VWGELQVHQFKTAEEKVHYVIYNTGLFVFSDENSKFSSLRLQKDMQRSLSTSVVNKRNGLISARNRKIGEVNLTRDSSKKIRLQEEIEELNLKIEEIDAEHIIEEATFVASDRQRISQPERKKERKKEKGGIKNSTFVDMPVSQLILGMDFWDFEVKRNWFGQEYVIKFPNEYAGRMLPEWVDELVVAIQETQVNNLDELVPYFHEYVSGYVFQNRPTTKQFCSLDHFLKAKDNESFRQMIAATKPQPVEA